MKKLMAAAAVVALVNGLAIAADIVIPEDNTPFTVQGTDVVRIPVKGIAGTQVKARVTGPAKATVNSISYRVQGKTPIGSGDQEVEVKPGGKGKVIVDITITPPNAPEKTEKYEFEVR